MKQVSIQEELYAKIIEISEESKRVNEKILEFHGEDQKIKLEFLRIKEKKLKLLKEESINKMKRHNDNLKMKLEEI